MQGKVMASEDKIKIRKKKPWYKKLWLGLQWGWHKDPYGKRYFGFKYGGKF